MCDRVRPIRTYFSLLSVFVRFKISSIFLELHSFRTWHAGSHSSVLFQQVNWSRNEKALHSNFDYDGSTLPFFTSCSFKLFQVCQNTHFYISTNYCLYVDYTYTLCFHIEFSQAQWSSYVQSNIEKLPLKSSLFDTVGWKINMVLMLLLSSRKSYFHFKSTLQGLNCCCCCFHWLLYS